LTKSIQLYYRCCGSIIFALSDDAEYSHRTHIGLQHAKTWGELRHLMPRKAYSELIERINDNEEDYAPEDRTSRAASAPFEPEQIPGYEDGDWPEWLATRMDLIIPLDVLRKFGEPTATGNGDYWHIDDADEAAVITVLRERGLSPIKRDDLLFS
jgi:hypothetical protein